MMATLIFILFVCILYSFLTSLLLTSFFGPPFIPSGRKRIATMLKFGEPTKQDKIIDIGSGDGRIVIELAKKGYTVSGIEINPFLYLFSNLRIKLLGLKEKAHVYHGNFRDFDYTGYTLVLCYLYPEPMRFLGPVFKNQLPKGARIVSHAFSIPDWKYKKKENKIYLYINE